VAIFHLLKNGRPLIDFESLKELFEFLKFSLMPPKNWINSSGWGMARAIHNVILKKNQSGFAAKQIYFHQL
jgi:hypothetical protein